MNNEGAQKLPKSGEAEREARVWLENYCDKRLGKGQRPCGWPNFGSIRVDEVVVMLAACANEARLVALEAVCGLVTIEGSKLKLGPFSIGHNPKRVQQEHTMIVELIRALKAAPLEPPGGQHES